MERERILKVTHGGIAGEVYNMVTITFDPLADFRRDPIGMLRSIAKDAGYRMVDLFNDFDKDGNQYISKDEFIHGIKVKIIFDIRYAVSLTIIQLMRSSIVRFL